MSFMLISSVFMVPVLSQQSDLLDPLEIPKWVNQIDEPPPVFEPENISDNEEKLIRQEYVVSIVEFDQQILPIVDENEEPTGFGLTKVYGYAGEAKDAITGENLGFVRSTPGPTFEAIQGVPIQVKWVNDLKNAEGDPLTHIFPVDPTLHWANPNDIDMSMLPSNAPPYPPGYLNVQSPVPIVTHLHGGEVSSISDGHPEAWWTSNGIHGSAYTTTADTDANSAVYIYPNSQQPATLWYHDHALGITRINVLSGLAGFYIIRDSNSQLTDLLPNSDYEMPLVIQDRSFQDDGSFYFPSQGTNPDVHPYWHSEFLGNTIIVNGKVWPNMNVKQGQYRFRIINGSNARFYELKFSNNMAFFQIGSDGGYLKSPAPLTSLLLAPAERADILVDFSSIPAGQKITLQNDALIDFSENEIQTVGQIMQFTIINETGFTPKSLPSNLNPTLAGDFPSLSPPEKQRILTLTRIDDSRGTVEFLLDGQKWGSAISENPELGKTEDWMIVNPTMNAHPIHVHLVQFQLVGRQTFNAIDYLSDWQELNGNPPFDHPTQNVPSLEPYYIGPLIDSTPSEQGWKDTVIAPAGQVTVIRLRFLSQNGSEFPFDATEGPGYVWHCHILDHEDNEMMRPMKVISVNNELPIELIILIGVIGTMGILVILFVRYKYLRKNSMKK